MADISVFVLIALELERVKECIVLEDRVQAFGLFDRLKRIYGGANVTIASRQVNDVPWLLVIPEQEIVD